MSRYVYPRFLGLCLSHRFSGKHLRSATQCCQSSDVELFELHIVVRTGSKKFAPFSVNERLKLSFKTRASTTLWFYATLIDSFQICGSLTSSLLSKSMEAKRLSRIFAFEIVLYHKVRLIYSPLFNYILPRRKLLA